MMRTQLVTDRITLTRLKRAELQEIAKREGIKANGKNAAIIELLIKKFPEGVPRRQTPSPTAAGKSANKNTPLIKAEPDAGGSTISARRSTKRQRVESHPALNVRGHLSSARSVRFPAVWAESTVHAAPPIVEPIIRERSPPPAPGNKDVRFVQREMVRLINDGVDIRVDVDETETLLARVVAIVNEVSLDFKELQWMRRTIETTVVQDFKTNRGLWDGWLMMDNEGDRERWAEYLQELDDEAEGRKQLLAKKEALENEEHAKQSALQLTKSTAPDNPSITLEPIQEEVQENHSPTPARRSKRKRQFDDTEEAPETSGHLRCHR